MIEPRKCALRFKPPTLVLLYWDPSCGKHRRRSMPLRGIYQETSVESYAYKLLSHPNHSTYVQSIPSQQLHSLLHKIKYGNNLPPYNGLNLEQEEGRDYREEKSCIKGKEQHNPSGCFENTVLPYLKVNSTFKPPNILGSNLPDLNSKPPMEEKRPQQLNKSVTHEDNDIIGAGVKVPECSDVISESKQKGDRDTKVAEDERTLSFSFHTSTQKDPDSQVEDSDDAVNEDLLDMSTSLEIHGIITGDNSAASNYSNEDLNKVCDQVLEKKKTEMNVLFEHHHLKPGDKDYKYDRQLDFSPPKIESGWDSDSCSDF